MRTWQSWLLMPILILGFGVRLYKLTTPLGDWHSWRQADTASVAVEYVKHGLDVLRPTYLDLSNIPSGRDNPKGYRMVEFPLIPALVAVTFSIGKTFGWELHVWFRFINILFSLGSIFMLYRIVKLLDGQKTALIAAAVFAFLPYNVFYSRTVLPEVSLVFFSLTAVLSGLSTLLSTPCRPIHYVLFTLSAALAMLLKPTAIFLLAPVLGMYLWQLYKKEISIKKVAMIGLLFALSLSPLLLWRLWISQFPEGIPANLWLLNGNGIRFKGAWFRWLFADRLGRLILGYWGLVPFSLGILSLGTRNSSVVPRNFYLLFLFSMVSYLSIFATGNVQHDYYQVILVPILSILIARGISHLDDQKNLLAPFISLLALVFTLAFGWFEIRGYYNINNQAMVEAGKTVDELTPRNALVIAPYQGDTAFLYQTNRRGWPIGGEIEAKIKAGASYYVTTSLDAEAQELLLRYPVVSHTNQYLLIRLTPHP